MDSAKRRDTFIDLKKLKKRKIACSALDLEQDYGDTLDDPSYEGLEQMDAISS
jgi:hypothetical protein